MQLAAPVQPSPSPLTPSSLPRSRLSRRRQSWTLSGPQPQRPRLRQGRRGNMPYQGGHGRARR
eukprot:8482935-Lingulodinium_polyedra.AAC.1